MRKCRKTLIVDVVNNTIYEKVVQYLLPNQLIFVMPYFTYLNSNILRLILVFMFLERSNITIEYYDDDFRDLSIWPLIFNLMFHCHDWPHTTFYFAGTTYLNEPSNFITKEGNRSKWKKKSFFSIKNRNIF